MEFSLGTYVRPWPRKLAKQANEMSAVNRSGREGERMVSNNLLSVKVKVFAVVVQFEFPQASIRNGPVGNCGHGET